jgi:hypothetical protein
MLLTYETNSVDSGVRCTSSSDGGQAGWRFFASKVLSRLWKLRVQTGQLWHLMQEWAKLSWMLERLQFRVIQLNAATVALSNVGISEQLISTVRGTPQRYGPRLDTTSVLKVRQRSEMPQNCPGTARPAASPAVKPAPELRAAHHDARNCPRSAGCSISGRC